MAGRRDKTTWRTLVETEEFRQQCDALRKWPEVDDALAGLLWGIAAHPEAFDLVPGYEPIRLARTDPFSQLEEIEIPRVRVWFRILDRDNVELLYMEAESGEDLFPEGLYS